MSSDIVIAVDNLSKRYVIGHDSRHDNLRDALHHTARKLWRRFRWGTGFRTEEFWALRDVSFEIKRGEVVGIIGRNGAGKSTLLKILSRITEPTAGRVTLRGRVASLLEVGTGFHPELTGRENIFLNGAILGMRRDEIRRKFDEIVAFAEVERFLDTPVKYYSSGMYVRLAFAVAAHLEPEILIVDEVLAVGDYAFQKKCLGKMETVSRNDGRTILFVSHNLFAVHQLCQRVVTLEKGRLFSDGTPEAQIRHYMGANVKQDACLSLASAARALNPVGHAQLRSVSMASGHAGSPWVLPFDGVLELVFTIHVSQPLHTLELGLGIFNTQGFEIISTLSSWQQELGPAEPGEYSISVNYGNIELAPAVYRFGVGLKSNAGLEDYLPEAFDIEIAPSENASRLNLSTIRGAVARSARFKIERID
ncbi:MAG TPA: ABC transporter ATP-binding protein [Opitutaceae bacterium]|nr:ABC transporter ATP-binding protein [Opitutaceae bacterium]